MVTTRRDVRVQANRFRRLWLVGLRNPKAMRPMWLTIKFREADGWSIASKFAGRRVVGVGQGVLAVMDEP